MWKPSTFEDRLLDKYLDMQSGELFLELPVKINNRAVTARKIDGILIPGNSTKVYPEGSYTITEALSAIKGENVELIEAKRKLNRNVIGQVVAGVTLFESQFNAAAVQGVVVCGSGNPDLEWVCEQHGIKQVQFDIESTENTGSISIEGRKDIRKGPDKNRRNAFLAGWTDAENGTLYSTVTKKKSHANMGNLFGWIYGEQTEEFKLQTWERYKNSLS